MSKLIAIGEALIDFIPNETGKQIKEVGAFVPKVGGAPTNVCGVFAKMGEKNQLITQLGNDPFADKILDEFHQFGIGCDYISRTSDANTSLAFVALQDDGNREFSFYRNPGADMLLEAGDIKEEWFNDADILHFCSVSLGDFPMKDAHRRAIEIAQNKDMLISFDPNLRFPLWNDLSKLKEAVTEFIPYAHVLKVSDEEIEFITGSNDINSALDVLFTGNVQMVIYTKGADGAAVYTRKNSASSSTGKHDAVDTTGAGDAFIGSFLWQLVRDGVKSCDIEGITAEKLKEYLDFSNKYCGISVMRHGAIASYPGYDEM